MPDVLVLLIIILIVVLVWRGPKTIPQLGNMLGRGVKEVRNEATEFQKDRDAKSGDQAPPPPPA